MGGTSNTSVYTPTDSKAASYPKVSFVDAEGQKQQFTSKVGTSPFGGLIHSLTTADGIE